MNHEDYCSYELSKKLKEKGFDWECNYFYDINYRLCEYLCDDMEDSSYNNFNHRCCESFAQCSVPTLSQAHKWLREEKGIDVFVIPHKDKMYKAYIKYSRKNVDGTADFMETLDACIIYEQALSAGVTKALELI